MKNKGLGCMDSDLEERMVAVTGEKEGGRQAREGAVSEAGFIISTGWEEAMPTQGSRGTQGFLQPEGLAVLGTKIYIAQGGLPKQPRCNDGHDWLCKDKDRIGAVRGQRSGLSFRSLFILPLPGMSRQPPLATRATPGTWPSFKNIRG